MCSSSSPTAAVASTRSISQTVSRGIRVMELLADAGTTLSAQEISDSLKVDRAVTYRLLRTLAAHKLVATAQNGGYTLGVGLLALSRGVQRNLREIAFPHLLTLAQRTNATAFIGVREGEELVCVATLEPPTALVSVRFREGLRRPMSHGASAIAIKASLHPNADDTEEVKKARELGYALSSGSVETATSAVSSPLSLPGGAGQACVTAIFPSSHSSNFQEIATHVMNAAKSISDDAAAG